MVTVNQIRERMEKFHADYKASGYWYLESKELIKDLQEMLGLESECLPDVSEEVDLTCEI